MARITQREIILACLRDIKDWYPAHKIGGRKTKYGFTGSESDRRCLELEEDKLIEGRMNGKFKEYRAKPPTNYEHYTIYNKDGTVMKDIKIPHYETPLPTQKS